MRAGEARATVGREQFPEPWTPRSTGKISPEVLLGPSKRISTPGLTRVRYLAEGGGL